MSRMNKLEAILLWIIRIVSLIILGIAIYLWKKNSL
jgi:hypothetical protein